MIAIDASDLESALRLLALSSQSDSPHPVIGSARLRSAGPGAPVEVTATDLEVWSTVAVRGSADASIDVLIPLRRARALCASASGEVRIARAQDVVKVSIARSRSRYQFESLPPEQFPESDSPEGDRLTCTVDASELAAALKRVSHAMADRDVRAALNGAHLDVSQDGVEVAATDGYRVAVASCALADGEPQGSFTVNLSRAGVAQLLVHMRDDERVRLSVAQGAAVTPPLVAAGDGWRMQAAQIVGQYPDYRRMWRAPEADGLVAFDAADMVAALGRLRAVEIGRSAAPAVRIEARNGVLVLRAVASGNEGVEEVATTQVGSEPFPAFGLNLRYLLDALRVRSGQVTLRVRSPHDPAIIEGGGGDTASAGRCRAGGILPDVPPGI